MHHSHFTRTSTGHALLTVLTLVFIVLAPDQALAQASPFMTGAMALQTNARVAREYLVALPAELDAGSRIKLARGFSQELTDRYGFALDLTVHAPRNFPGSDPRNFHAHLLATTREATAAGLAGKTSLEFHDARRRDAGLEPSIHELLHVRERWATVTNAALQEAHIDARIDHRSLAAQGIDREPYPHIPRAAFEMERHGYRSFQADRLREEYHQRQQARMERSAAASAKPQTLEETRREARENWLKLRQSTAQAAPADAGHAKDDSLSR